MFRCARIQGLDTHEGLLLFGREHYYVIDGFTLLKTKEICDIDALPPGVHEPIIPNPNPDPAGSMLLLVMLLLVMLLILLWLLLVLLVVVLLLLVMMYCWC